MAFREFYDINIGLFFQFLGEEVTWNICVVSDCIDGKTADLKNALLYGSDVVWLPPSWATAAVMSDMLRNSHDIGCEDFLSDWCKRLSKTMNLELFKLVQAGNLVFNGEMLSKGNHVLEVYLEKTLREKGKSFNLKDDEYFLNIVDEFAGITKSNINELISRSHAALIEHQSFIVDWHEEWNSHQAAQELMNAMQRVLLTDVSHLTLEEIQTLRDKAKDELEPMRAEMLRLTEFLEERLGENKYDMNEVSREAENVIATRVEPFVREVNSRVESDTKQFASSILVDTTKALFLIGFGRLVRKPEYIESGLIDFARRAAEKFPDLPTLKADTAAARFVVEVRRGIKKRA